jgi:DEAD/DEAH box helicase domain-containing protein
LVAAARDRGIEQLYTHQAEAIEAALAGQHVVLATSTASGKTLAYNLPVLHNLLGDPATCALYLFPTKALAHDQLTNLKFQISSLGAPIAVRPYDGDTPSSHRPSIRRKARLLVTNPDMLHTGILPHHTRWARLFANLRYVVLDEIHTYRGIFGGHVANLLRRLRRVCRFYGSDPIFLCASATIANPRELAERLVEAPVTLLDDDGAPRGEKHFILYNPPLVDSQLGIRRSAALAAKDIAAQFVRANVQTIVFARARLTTEVLLGYLRDSVVAIGGSGSGVGRVSIPAEAVQGYRGGYLPGERRAIERGLREGEIRSVVATNALELGMDIGQLGACVMAGYPGTVASAWQQAGRAGRRAGLSVAMLVASALPLDQYLVTHPRYFFGRPVEQALLDPDNLAVLANHLTCAAFELPFPYKGACPACPERSRGKPVEGKRGGSTPCKGERSGPFGSGERFSDLVDVDRLLDVLAEEGILHRSADRYTWIGEGYPAARLSLRTSTPDNVVIQTASDESTSGVDAGSPEVIGQMDRPSAPMLIHEGAVYLHRGETYIVESLDWEEGIAIVRAAGLDYYTRASGVTEVCILEDYSCTRDEGTGAQRRTLSGYGEVLVTTRATGYRKIKRYTHEVLGWAPIDLPEQEMRTVGYWLVLSEELATRLQKAGVLPPPTDYGPDWAAQRDRARARDMYRCRHCGAPEREGRQHDVHHVIPFRAFGYVPGVNDLHKLANQLGNLVTLCPACHRRVERGRGARGAMSGMAYLLRNLAPLHLMCDPGDLGSAVQIRALETGLPTVTLYDQAPGGAGLSARLYELQDELLEAALDVVRRCPCSDGCPGCVGPADDTEPGAKALTNQLLAAIVEK